MKDLAKGSIVIQNDYELYPFALKCDAINGIIQMHKNTQNKTRTITRRNIPITNNQRWGFYNSRSGWDGKCSYISKEKSPEQYTKWLKFMCDKYIELKKLTKEN